MRGKKSNKKEFVERSKIVHKDKYNYDKFDYKGARIKGIITCEKHGDFQQTPDSHLSGRGCPKCGGTSKSDLEEFVQKAKLVHNNFYDYSNTDYILSRKKVKIICPIHGDFEQTPAMHLNGNGCPECRYIKSGNSLRSNLEEFVEKADKIHNNFYDYSKVDYKQSQKKIKIICPIHGDFEQTPAMHLNGNGCPKCAGNSKSNSEEFVEKAKLVHNNFYDYSKVDYINALKKIKIICPIHGDFEQTPASHLSGHGCPECGKERQRELQNIRWQDRFSEGILYLIECWNDVERFVKIGVTSKTVKERYKRFGSMPYNYSILKEIQMDSKTVSDTEQYIIDFYESYKPKITFGGDTECLRIDEKYQIVEYLENLEKDLCI